MMPPYTDRDDDAGRIPLFIVPNDPSLALLDAIGSPIRVLDRVGWIVRANRACAELIGRITRELVERPFWELLLDAVEAERVRRWFADPAAQRSLLSCATACAVPPDGRRPIAWQLAAIANERRGAVVLVRPPAHLFRLEAKRIDALPGDLRRWGGEGVAARLRPISHGQVFLTGDAIRAECATMIPPTDSRGYGPCPAPAIVARIYLRIWPIARFGHVSRKHMEGGEL